MGILDQLRNEADQKKADTLDQSAFKDQLENNYQTDILPSMQITFQFMKLTMNY